MLTRVEKRVNSRCMETDDNKVTSEATGSAVRDGSSIRVSRATLDKIEEARSLMAAQAVAGLPNEHGATLSIHITPDEIVNMALGDWLARAKTLRQTIPQDRNTPEVTPVPKGKKAARR